MTKSNRHHPLKKLPHSSPGYKNLLQHCSWGKLILNSVNEPMQHEPFLAAKNGNKSMTNYFFAYLESIFHVYWLPRRSPSPSPITRVGRLPQAEATIAAAGVWSNSACMKKWLEICKKLLSYWLILILIERNQFVPHLLIYCEHFFIKFWRIT